MTRFVCRTCIKTLLPSKPFKVWDPAKNMFWKCRILGKWRALFHHVFLKHHVTRLGSDRRFNIRRDFLHV